MLQELPPSFNVEEMKQIFPIQEKQWINFLLISELERYNCLLNIIGKDLNALFVSLSEDEEVTNVS